MTPKKHEVSEELLVSLLADYKKSEELIGQYDLYKQLIMRLVEKVLEAELTEQRAMKRWPIPEATSATV